MSLSPIRPLPQAMKWEKNSPQNEALLIATSANNSASLKDY